MAHEPGDESRDVQGLLTADVLDVIRRFALRLAGDVHIADELVQETCLRAWQHRRQLRKPDSARSWLLQILANLWRDRIKQIQLPTDRFATADVADASTAADDALITEENLARGMAELQALPPMQRDVLYLAAVEGLRRNEIAEILGTSISAVKTNLSIARGKMRQRLTDIWEDL